MSEPTLLWVDVETTGLNPKKGQILELAVVKTDTDLKEIKKFHSFVHYGNGVSPFDLADEYVQEMHTKNGLWREHDRSEGQIVDNIREVEDVLLLMSIGDKRPILAGSSVHFDRSWLEVHFPNFAKAVSYRNFDVSTLLQAFVWWGEGEWPKANAHRALPDVMESLTNARTVREIL